MKPRKIMKRRREKLGLTQGQAAKKIRLTRSAYANFENGHRTITPAHIPAIARALHLRASRLA